VNVYCNLPSIMDEDSVKIMENLNLFVPTLNKQGFAATNLDRFSKEFTSFEDGDFLEIGAAFGYATLKALENGACVTANDTDSGHLKHIKNVAEKRGFNKLNIAQGSFPEQLEFPDNTFQKILISRVLHFFTGQQIQSAMKTINKWLKPNGKVFIVCETPYLKNWTLFSPEYEKRKQDGIIFPGEITCPKNWENNRTENLPEFVHWLDKETLVKLVSDSGLEIIGASYIDRSGQFPHDLLLDGRESVGIIGKKSSEINK
jgi:SAM-dependent methyltransferase